MTTSNSWRERLINGFPEWSDAPPNGHSVWLSASDYEALESFISTELARQEHEMEEQTAIECAEHEKQARKEEREKVMEWTNQKIKYAEDLLKNELTVEIQDYLRGKVNVLTDLQTYLKSLE